MISIIGQFRKADNLPMHDRTNGRPAAQDFILRVREGIASIMPKVDEETFKCIKQAVNAAEAGKTPCIVKVNDLEVQIFSIG